MLFALSFLVVFFLGGVASFHPKSALSAVCSSQGLGHVNTWVQVTRLHAKKEGGAKGFAPVKKNTRSPKSSDNSAALAQPSSSSSSAASPGNEVLAGGVGAGVTGYSGQDGVYDGTSSASDADIDAIFKKYGIDDRASRQKREADAAKKKLQEQGKEVPFGEAIMAKLTPEAQMKIDKQLVTGVSASLLFVLLCGVGISAGSLRVVYPSLAIPEGVEDAIANFFTPAFTPALGVFFLFSTTFGLFKFAQISSSQTVYKE